MALGRLLVIGGRGFIGRNLCRAARDDGYAVTSLSLHPGGTECAGVRELYADIADPIDLAAALANEKFEYVVNAGGYIDHRLFQSGGRVAIKSHFSGVQNVIELLDWNCLAGFVQLGSSDEYGSAPAPQREDARESPISPYSLAKLAATHFLQMLWRTEQFPAVALRLFLTYGPGQAETRLLAQVIRGCLQDRRFPVSEGLQVRDLCHVADVVRGILQTLKSPKARGEVINLASGVPASIRNVIELARELIGKGTPVFGQIPCRAGENPQLYADIAKARLLVGWQPEISLVDGLQDTINFYRSALSSEVAPQI